MPYFNDTINVRLWRSASARSLMVYRRAPAPAFCTNAGSPYTVSVGGAATPPVRMCAATASGRRGPTSDSDSGAHCAQSGQRRRQRGGQALTAGTHAPRRRARRLLLPPVTAGWLAAFAERGHGVVGRTKLNLHEVGAVVSALGTSLPTQGWTFNVRRTQPDGQTLYRQTDMVRLFSQA